MKFCQLRLALLAFLLIAACKHSPDEVVKRRFPQCFAEPRIGASEGVRCDKNEKTTEWKIVFWKGQGDCPAGCIEKEDYAWYRVDNKGKVFECDASGKDIREVPGDGKIEPEKKPESTMSSASLKEDPTACAAADECFFYECCESQVMSKNYRAKHWRELSLDAPDKEACNLKCMHEFAPADKRPACVAHQCFLVNASAPPVDPDKEVVWVGRPVGTPSCENPDVYLDQQLKDRPQNAPPIFARASIAPAPPGPKYKTWTVDQEKKMMQKDGGTFTCKACYTCLEMSHDFALVYKSDLPSFEKEGWKRVDE